MLRKLVIVLVVLVIALFVTGFFLPSTFESRAKGTVLATPEHVYGAVADLRRWVDWTVWSPQADPDCTWAYTGDPGAGMTMRWEGPKLGVGQLVIEDADVGSGVTYRMELEGMEPLRGAIRWQAAGVDLAAGLDVEWYDRGDMGKGWMAGWVAWLMPLEGMQRTNLDNLADHLGGEGR